MTVIAFDGKTLVADGRCTRHDGSLATDSFVKLYRAKVTEFGGDCIVGVSGCVDSIGPFLKHIETNGIVPMEHFKFSSPQEEEHFHIRAIAVNKKGKCFEFTSDGGWFEVNGQTSIGSGEIIAQHYLLKGCDALTAVVETCKTELSCGGSLMTYDWKTNKLAQITP